MTEERSVADGAGDARIFSQRADEAVRRLARWSLLLQIVGALLIQGGRPTAAAMQMLAGIAAWLAGVVLAVVGSGAMLWNISRIAPARIFTALVPWLVAAGLVAALILFY